MIPKIIHYCWFGGNELPKSAVKCVNSWKKFCPDYKIIEWNEQNFDISSAPLYVRQAYENKKFAFVADYVRLYALYNHGGIYMDTDVEVVKNLDNLLNNKAFSGFENDKYIAMGIIGCEQKLSFIEDFLAYYRNTHFIKDNGSLNMVTNVSLVTKMLIKKGLKPNGTYQKIDDIVLFPKDYFYPFDDLTGLFKKTENTYTIHWYDKTWIPFHQRIRTKLTRPFHRIFGVDCFEFLKKK